jgi:general secretion pathway protein C
VEPKKAANSSASAALGANIRARSETEFDIPRLDLDRIVAEMNTVLSEAQSIPVIKDGGMQGLRLFGIRPESLYTRLGFRNGDVITRINGEKLDSMSKGLQLFARLQDTRRVDVEMEHGGVAIRKTYHLE